MHPVAEQLFQIPALGVPLQLPIEKEQQMAVPFAVLNLSARTIEVLPPQIQLAGTSKDSSKATRTSWLRVRTSVLPNSCCSVFLTALSEMFMLDAISLFDKP